MIQSPRSLIISPEAKFREEGHSPSTTVTIPGGVRRFSSGEDSTVSKDVARLVVAGNSELSPTATDKQTVRRHIRMRPVKRLK